jgi:hypothetical protein
MKPNCKAIVSLLINIDSPFRIKNNVMIDGDYFFYKFMSKNIIRFGFVSSPIILEQTMEDFLSCKKGPGKVVKNEATM